MREHEKPEWQPLDSLRSIIDIGRTALNELTGQVDTNFADKIITFEE